MKVFCDQDARTFCDKALPYLLKREAENNLIIGIVMRLADENESWGDNPPLLCVIEDEGEMVSAAIQTPLRNLLLTRMNLTAAAHLADFLRSIGYSLPGVMGPSQAAEAFVACWAAEKTIQSQKESGLRIYQLEKVIPPRPPGGHAEEATPADAQQLIGWLEDFIAHTDPAAGRPEEIVKQALEKKQFWLWKNPDPVSLARFCAPTVNGIRINFVYTPHEHRCHGYATANVATLSQRMLDRGHKFCCLFASQANTISNSIYQKIGYEKVCDIAQYRFS